VQRDAFALRIKVYILSAVALKIEPLEEL